MSNNTYTILDSRICVGQLRTATVRMQATESSDPSRTAIQWVFRDGRFTDFSGSKLRAEELNTIVASLAGDATLVDEMNEFVSKYTH